MFEAGKGEKREKALAVVRVAMVASLQQLMGSSERRVAVPVGAVLAA